MSAYNGAARLLIVALVIVIIIMHVVLMINLPEFIGSIF